jgi:translation initiation factor IF-1
MAHEDMVTVENAVVVDVNHSTFTVEYAVGTEKYRAACTLGGKLRKNHIRVVLGDRVHVRLSPADLTKGIIFFRPRA